MSIYYATLDEAKKHGCVGCQFTNKFGAVGTVLEGLSDHKKARAEFNCIVSGCGEKHVRESSDWHQASKCRKHARKKKAKGARTAPVESSAVSEAVA